jgi:DNA topoisomerase-2
VTELPIGLWTYDFKAALEVLIDKYPEVKSYTNNSSNVSVDFTVTFATREAANAWYTCDASNFSKFEVETKMNSGSRYLSTTNMHLFDASGKIKKYGDVSEIVSEFVSVRYTHYVLRKAREIETLSHDALFLAEKARFISSVVDGSIVLHEMTADDVIYSVLRNLNFATFDGNYKYLLNMPLSSLSIDKRNALTAEVEKTRQAIEHLEGKSIEKMWTDDLDAFEKVL